MFTIYCTKRRKRNLKINLFPFKNKNTFKSMKYSNLLALPIFKFCFFLKNYFIMTIYWSCSKKNCFKIFTFYSKIIKNSKSWKHSTRNFDRPLIPIHELLILAMFTLSFSLCVCIPTDTYMWWICVYIFFQTI